MDNPTNTRCEATVKIIAFHVFIMISIFLIIAGITVNSLFPVLIDSRLDKEERDMKFKALDITLIIAIFLVLVGVFINSPAGP